MNIAIGTPQSIFKTIGHDEKFKPVLYWKIGQRKQALMDLANFFDKFREVLATGIQFDEADYTKYAEQFHQKAMEKAKEVLERSLEHGMYKDRFFTYL